MGHFDEKVAVVTGGGTGIGLAIARRFANEGAQVVIVGRGKQRLDEAVAQIGHGAYGVPADVGKDEQIRAVFEPLERVDILVTCAGTAVFGAIEELPTDAWRELFDGRFFGQMNACHYAVPKMPEGGVIMLCSGIAGKVGLNLYSGGTALCGAVNALGRALAVELAPKGIRVNVLSPGLIQNTASSSNLTEEQRADYGSQWVSRIPLHRPGNPIDMAEAAQFLALCEYATGMVLDVDGGWTAS